MRFEPWQLAPEAINEVLHYTASRWVERPDKWQSCQLSTNEDVREVPIPKVGPEMGELQGLDQPVLDLVTCAGFHQVWHLPENLKKENQATVDKMCLVC